MLWIWIWIRIRIDWLAGSGSRRAESATKIEKSEEISCFCAGCFGNQSPGSGSDLVLDLDLDLHLDLDLDLNLNQELDPELRLNQRGSTTLAHFIVPTSSQSCTII